MLDALLDRHAEFLPAIFAATVVALAWLEAFFPRRALDVPRWRRWVANFSLGTINGLIFRVAIPVGAFTAAVLAAEHGWGALRLLPMPDWLALVLGVLAIDVFVYGYHRLMHAVPVLWRLHRVHHSDPEIDFTTTIRHHPLDALLGGAVIFAITVAFGVSPASVVLHQGALIVIEFLSHGNLRIPRALDGWLRLAIVTPDMHVVHHSALKRETDSNFATGLSVWDRMFGTYVAAPAQGLTGMTIGLEYWRGMSDQRIDRLLLSPLARPPFVNSAAEPVGGPIPATE